MSLDFIFNILISDYAGNKHYHIIFYWFEFMRVSSAGPSKYFRSTQILPRTSCSSKQRNPWIRGKLFLICMQKHSSMNHIIADHDCIFLYRQRCLSSGTWKSTTCWRSPWTDEWMFAGSPLNAQDPEKMFIWIKKNFQQWPPYFLHYPFQFTDRLLFWAFLPFVLIRQLFKEINKNVCIFPLLRFQSYVCARN